MTQARATLTWGAEIPWADERPEIVLGKYDTEVVPVEELVMLSQVRGGANPESKRLKQSIAANGMINPIDVAKMSRADLETYIEFVNSTWGSHVTIDQYLEREKDGYYYLVVAGHSRTLAVLEMAQENPDMRYGITCKIHPIHSSEDIINL